ncbi:MAG: hypothetical protein AAB209_07510 [Bacteroidota bacterium]
MRHLLTLLFLSFLISSKLSHAQEVPPWAKHLPNVPNRPDLYQGLGAVSATGDVAADWQKATGQARADIVAQIRVVVSNAVVRKVEEVINVSETKLSDLFQTTTEQIAEGTLEGVEIQRWYDEKNSVYYAYAAVSKSEVERRFAERIENTVNAASIQYRAARKALEGSNVYFALTQLFEATKTIFLGESYLHKTLVADLAGNGTQMPSLAFLQSELCGVLSKLRFETVSGANQEGERDKALQQPLIGRVMYSGSDREVPMKSAPLTVSFVSPSRGKLTEEVQTDERGTFTIVVTDIQGGEAANNVRVKLALAGIEPLSQKLPEVTQCWTNAYLDIPFRLRVRTNINIAIHILENRLGKPQAKSSLQEEIQTQLIGGRYALVEESKVFGIIPQSTLNGAIESGDFDVVVKSLASIADVVIVGSASTKERSNPAPQIFFCTGSAILHVIDAKTGRLLANASIDGEKIGGASYEVASIKTLERLAQRLAAELKSKLDEALR